MANLLEETELRIMRDKAWALMRDKYPGDPMIALIKAIDECLATYATSPPPVVSETPPPRGRGVASLEAIIAYANVATAYPDLFGGKQAVRNLRGPAFDDARAAVAKAKGWGLVVNNAEGESDEH